MGTINFNINVSIEASDAEALQRQTALRDPSSIADILPGVATWLLQAQARGGIMIEPAPAQRIRKALRGHDSAETIVAAVEASVNMDGDTVVAKIRLDPSYKPYFEEIASSQGRDIQQLYQGVMDLAIERGWVYEHLPPMHRLIFTAEQIREIEELIGHRGLTGEDVANYILERATLPQLVTPGDDVKTLATLAAARVAGPEEKY